MPQDKTPDNVAEFYAKVHQEMEKCDKAVEFVEVLAKAPTFPPEVQVEFAKLASVLRIQKQMIIHLLEENAQIYDKIEDIVKRLPSE